MTELRRWHPRVACAVSFLFCALFATPSAAGLIYNFREVGSSDVIGTFEIASPPATLTMGWTTSSPSDFIALSLDPFGGNLLSASADFGGTVLSLDGLNLDGGGIGINFPTIFPGRPGEPIVDRVMSLDFSGLAGSDLIGVGTTSTYPDGTVTIGDLFLAGDWTVAAVPEPGIAALLGIALAAAGVAAKRRRR
jgi:hypothetical protein